MIMLSQRVVLSLVKSRSTPATTRTLHSPTLCRPFHLRPTNLESLQCRLSIRKPQQRVVATSAKTHARRPLRLGRIVNKTLTFLGIVSLTLFGSITAFFLYDASTYKEETNVQDVGVLELALYPRKGGLKNLPIAEVLLDDDMDELEKLKDKPRLVILGCGWGSVALLKSINPDNYHITVISPTNYFLYTPLLPSATVGTLEVRSLIEPIRRITRASKGHFLKASAVDVDFSAKLVEVSQELPNGERSNFYVPYDKLVIGIGSNSRTHGVEGLEHVHFLKNINDARKIRSSVIENFERACLPTTTDEERKRLLSFVICGGGPTGVEFAAELYDMLNEDLTTRYPRILRNEVSVHIVQSRSHILNTYDEALSEYAERRFARSQIDVQTNSRVSRIEKDKVLFTQKNPETGATIGKEIPFGMCLWSTGVAQTDFAEKIANSLEVQQNRHALETDPYLRLLGTPLGDVYAIGDCATVQNNITEYIANFLKQVAWENGIKDERKLALSFAQWRTLVPRIRKSFPASSDHLRRLDRLFEQYDEDKSGTLDFQELNKLIEDIDKKLTSLPATAQRAHQQGIYLAHKFNKFARAAQGLKLNQVLDGDIDAAVYKAFEYKHLGNLAYVGNAAVFDLNGMSFAGGLIFLYLWRGVYFAQGVSTRTRMLLAMDWTKRALFGRDLMNF